MDAQDVQRFVSHASAHTYTVFEGVGHGIHLERPTEYVQALQRFMSAVSPQRVSA